VQVSLDTKELETSLDKYIVELKRKLEAMVAGFAYEVTLILSSNTPVGDDFAIQNVIPYRRFYEMRNAATGLPLEAGYHAGAWEYTESSPTFLTQIVDRQVSANDAYSTASYSYNIGDKFYIAAKGPAFNVFESGYNRQAPDGILRPSIQQIMQISMLDLKRYFDNG
jgi:hypothetical protein